MIETMIILYTLGVVCLLDLAVFAKLRTSLQQLRINANKTEFDGSRPTVSICIAARDETHAMTQCLERAVASDYPKLEIIVLDDGSRDNTSLLIKSFAHAGVRFVEGQPLPDGWLGKNFALATLAREASGQYVFFMDVDTLIERHTVSRIIDYTLGNHAKMSSVIPIRNDRWQTSTLMTTMRYFWTVMSYSSMKPRAAANAWLIDRKLVLDEFETDTRLQLSVQIVTALAQKFAPAHAFKLMLSNSDLGLSYEKRWSSQIETSIRLLYPQNDKKWYRIALQILLLICTLVPYVAVWLTPWAWTLVVMQFGFTYYYLSHIWVRYRLVGAVLLPVTIIQEIILLLVSQYRYNFGQVTWKGRPITKRRVN